MSAPPEMLESLGLGGDGDEVDAIERVEAAFGVRLDVTDAVRWVTVGEVYSSLLRALSPERRNSPEIWPIFAHAMAEETGADPARVGPATRLLGEPLRDQLARWLGRPLRRA